MKKFFLLLLFCSLISCDKISESFSSETFELPEYNVLVIDKMILEPEFKTSYEGKHYYQKKEYLMALEWMNESFNGAVEVISVQQEHYEMYEIGDILISEREPKEIDLSDNDSSFYPFFIPHSTN